MKRQFDPAVPELMDRPQPVSRELEIDLHNLRQLNRYFGSYALVRHFLRRWINSGDMLRVLDLATGSGDIPRLILQHSRAFGTSVKVTAVDQLPATFKIALRFTLEFNQIQLVKHEAVSLTSTEAFNKVVCFLALHHSSDEGAVALLQHCRELSR